MQSAKILQTFLNFIQLGFTSSKAKELLLGMEFQEKEEEKDERQTTKAVYKEVKEKRCLLTLDLKLLRS